MRHTKSHTRNRRSHHKAAHATLTKDSDTGTTHLRHRMCLETGMYRGKKVIDVAKAVAKKHDKLALAEAKEKVAAPAKVKASKKKTAAKKDTTKATKKKVTAKKSVKAE